MDRCIARTTWRLAVTWVLVVSVAGFGSEAKFYALAPPPTALHRTLLRCLNTCLIEIESLAADRKRLAGMQHACAAPGQRGSADL